jgi:hypothetical protein
MTAIKEFQADPVLEEDILRLRDYIVQTGQGHDTVRDFVLGFAGDAEKTQLATDCLTIWDFPRLASPEGLAYLLAKYQPQG